MPGLKTKTLGPKSGCAGLNVVATAVVAAAVPAGRTARAPSARLTAITQSHREVYLRTLMSSSPLPSFLHATLRRSPQPHVAAHWNGVEADNSDVAVHCGTGSLVLGPEHGALSVAADAHSGICRLVGGVVVRQRLQLGPQVPAQDTALDRTPRPVCAAQQGKSTRNSCQMSW